MPNRPSANRPWANAARHLLITVALAALASGAAAAQGVCIVVGTCVAGDVTTLETDLKLSNGAVRKPGRNPPSRYFCSDLGLAAAQAAGAAPNWNTFSMQYRDLNASGVGHVRARLMRKSLETGTAVDLVRLPSLPSATLATRSAAIPEPFDFQNFVYFAIVEMATPLEPLEAHTLCLTTR